MNLKISQHKIQDKTSRDVEYKKNYPTLADLMKQQGVTTDSVDYWDNECDSNPSNPNCLIYED